MHFALILLTIMLAGYSQEGEYLQRVSKSGQVEVTRPGETQAFFRDPAIPAEAGERVYEYFQRHYTLLGGFELFAIPHTQLYLAAAATDTPETVDFGQRFYLLRIQPDSTIAVLSSGRGARESWILRPTFFLGQGRVLILAELGYEYTYGVQVCEVKGDSLLDLGTLNVGFLAPDSSYGYPAENARVRFDDDGYAIEFPPGLLLDPGAKDSVALIPKGEVAVFRQAGDHFNRIR
jgi:hypothetical protein